MGTVVATVAVPNETRNLDEPLERFAMSLVLVIPVTIVFCLIFVPLLSFMMKYRLTWILMPTTTDMLITCVL